MINRIQRLFLSEYRSLDDMVLVESPFAETTKEGYGIRQVHIGLTPTKLIIAADLLPEATAHNASVPKNVDPRTETLELLTVCGVECVTLSVYHRRHRQTLKAHFCNKTTAYYELGGFVMRRAYWNLWCERVRYLNPDCEIVRSCSETSAASSTTCSTKYILGKTCGAGEGGIQMTYCDQLMCTHGQTKAKKPTILDNETRAVWNERDVYLGDDLEEIRPENYRPAQPNYLMKDKPEPELTFIYRKPTKNKKKADALKSSSESIKEEECVQLECKESSIHRFAEGVSEQCMSALRLRFADPPPVEQHSLLQKTDPNDDLRHLRPLTPPCPPPMEPAELAERAVEQWEKGDVWANSRSNRVRHRRRYALTPKPHLLNGLGPWPLAQGERFSVQVKRAVSCVSIRRGNVDRGLLSSLPHRLLTATVSEEDLSNLKGETARCGARFAVQSEPAVMFWTPEFWYRPRKGHEAYCEQRAHLRTLPDRLACNYTGYKNKGAGGLCGYFKSRKTKKSGRKWKGPGKNESDPDLEDSSSRKVNSKLSAGCEAPCIIDVIKNQPKGYSTNQNDICTTLKKSLKVRKPFNAWNFDSTMLAYQLTMIDRKLFLKLTPREFMNVLWSQSSKSSPNFSALVAFGHRVTCLVTSSVLAEDDMRRRARLIARFIYTADKCNQIHNFQSCYNVLSGLQSPPCFRLRKTWSHVRKKHAQTHDLFEKLCKLYRDPRLPGYQRAFHLASRTAPYLPYIGHMVCGLLDRLPEVDRRYLNCPSSCKFPPKHTMSSPTRLGTGGPQSLDDLLLPFGQLGEEGDGDIDDDELSYAVRRQLMTALRLGAEPSCSSSCDLLDFGLENSPSVAYWRQYSRGYTDMDIVDNCIQFFQPILEDNRAKKLEEVLESLDLAQKAAMRYALKIDPEAGEFLYRARYREDPENFLISIAIEP